MSCSKRWEIRRTAPLARHMLPLDDTVDHDTTEGCVCGPQVELIEVGGFIAQAVLHHALDGRKDWLAEVTGQ